ncbi:MAG: HEAT repeat domain-containing protein [Pseudomonadota bacterium]
MANTNKPYRIVAAVLGAMEIAALSMAVIAILSIGGNGLDKLLAVLAFYIFLPVAVIIGIFLGIRFGSSATAWGFARPRQVIISMIVALLFLYINDLSQDRGELAKDPFVSASADMLIQSLSDRENEYNRLSAAQELVQRNYPSAGELILPLLQDKSGDVRGRAACLLGQLRDKRAVDGIVILLDDKEYGTRLDAVWSLGEIRDNRAVSPLLEVLNRPNFSGVAAEALARIGDRRAVGPLIGFLESEDRMGRLQSHKWVISSLENLTGQKYGSDIARWRQWYEYEGKK